MGHPGFTRIAATKASKSCPRISQMQKRTSVPGTGTNGIPRKFFHASRSWGQALSERKRQRSKV